MSNRIYISVEENTASPSWLDEVEPFMQKVLEELKIDGEEISVLFCGDSYMQVLNKTSMFQRFP